MMSTSAAVGADPPAAVASPTSRANQERSSGRPDAVSQIQLVQPVLTILWAALLLGEPLTVLTVVGALAVIVCAAAAVRSRVRR
jgi:hypothetical protein